MIEVAPSGETIELDYPKAKYSRRVLAFMFDMLSVAVMSSLLLLGTRAIAERQPAFIEALETRERLQTASSLYVLNTDNKLDLITDYHADDTNYDDVNSEYETTLVSFYTNPEFFPQDDSASGIALYNAQKIGDTAIDGNYFIYGDAEQTQIIANPDYSAEKMNGFYIIAIEDIAYSYLNSHPDYQAASRVILFYSNLFILPISIVFSLLVFELAVPLIFSRGKQTFGRKIFKLGLVTANAVSPKAGRFLLKFSIFLFIEVIGSLFTFGLPLIFSVSMFFFSKSNQSFSDYMLGIYTVDVEIKMIYKSLEEYEERHSAASFNL